MNLVESIRIFRRVAETKSFSRVAKEIGVSQPTISKSIQALEKRLELILFRRTTRGLSLTVEGQKLYHSGGDLLDHVERVLAGVKNQRQTLRGELRVSASLAFARLVLAPLLREFSELHEDLRLNFILSDGYTDLVEHNIDVAFRIGDLNSSSLRAIKIGASRRALYAAKSYLKAHGRPKELTELRRHRLLYYTRLDERPSWTLRSDANTSAPFYFEPFLKTDGSDLMRESVLNGMGIALLPTWMMEQPEKEGIVDRLLEFHAGDPAAIFALSASAREITARQRAYVEFLRARFARIHTLAIHET